MGEFFKNTVGDGWETSLKNWVDMSYEEYNGVLYNKNELQTLGIDAEDYEASKVLIAKMLAKKLNLTNDLVNSDWTVAELNAIVDYNEIPEARDKEILDLVIDNYELIINTEDGELSLAVKAAEFEYQLPATMTTEDGTFWLTIPKDEFKAELNKINKELSDKKAKDAQKKAKIKKRNRLISETVKEQTKEIMP